MSVLYTFTICFTPHSTSIASMAAEEPNSGHATREPELPLLNFIFACSVCGATFADTYQGHNETVQGLSDGINPINRLVTKLFMGSCCHVFCSEHIEGGAPPFHPAGQKPQAPCPWCIINDGDHTVRDLYSIRGFHRDEYDPAIPSTWFTAPPASLDVHAKEREAVRFQYLALARYCQTTYQTRKPLTDALSRTEQELASTKAIAAEKLNSLQHDNEQQAGELQTLQVEVQRLQHLERERKQFETDLEAFRHLEVDVRNLETFRKNKAAILQYLKSLPTVIEQNKKMKERLASLGFAMAVEPVPNYTQLLSDDLDALEDRYTKQPRYDAATIKTFFQDAFSQSFDTHNTQQALDQSVLIEGQID
ncbi:hypothetical protein E8E13_010492 [Curvularia kusanoi]|uniref:Uncharacterized protein n=1 Tax=Curvularia kusanoi TaxID=90978 RepID=A0A9P4W9V0_CURKU|nr:hypothetical protein E8E13_010492 [Curvularia kusanoi]